MKAILFALALIGAPASAQVVVAPSSDQAARTAAAEAKAAADLAAANSCSPASVMPPMEAVTATAGVAQTCRRSDAVSPRITRSAIVTTSTGGTFAVTWAAALSSAPAVMLTPVAASASIDCQLTAAPTTTSVQGRCFTAQTLAITLAGVTAGLNLSPVSNSAAGIQVHVLAIPVTQ